MSEASTNDLPTLPLEALAIRAILPHRYPFLLIDRVIELEPEQSITAIKCVSQNEPFFAGHFPEAPIMPGVLQIEAMAQAGAILALLSQSMHGKLAMLTAVENAKFRRPVVPGDVLQIQILELRVRRTYGRARGQILVNGEMTCEAELGFALVDKDSGKL